MSELDSSISRLSLTCGTTSSSVEQNKETAPLSTKSPVAAEKIITLNTLKKKLLHHKVACGCITQKGTRCMKDPIRSISDPGNEEKINSLLDELKSMIQQPQVTEADGRVLDKRLKTLYGHIHCRAHDLRKYRAKCIKSWKEIIAPDELQSEKLRLEDFSSDGNASKFKVEIPLSRPKTKEDAYPLIKYTMLHELSKKDKKEGHVYVYQDSEDKKLYKVGYTEGLVEDRIAGSEKKCGRKWNLIYPKEMNPPKIPCARRVEQLCHTQLRYGNEEIHCQSCGNVHIEWFRISGEEIQRVVKQWTAWIKMDPYRMQPSNEENEQQNNIATLMMDLLYIGET
jgi:T5orf172 domain